MVDDGKEGGVGGGKGCAAGVNGPVGERAGYDWAVKEGGSRWLWCLWVREQVGPSPRCCQKQLSHLEGASLGGGVQKTPGHALQPPPLVAIWAFLGGAEERSVGGPSPLRPQRLRSPLDGTFPGGVGR